MTFLVMFDNVQDGVRCALDMMACSKAYNRRLTDKKMRIEFGGIGLDWGEVTIENPSGNMYGLAADGAFLFLSLCFMPTFFIVAFNEGVRLNTL